MKDPYNIFHRTFIKRYPCIPPASDPDYNILQFCIGIQRKYLDPWSENLLKSCFRKMEKVGKYPAFEFIEQTVPVSHLYSIRQLT